jgi:hypothetical protein
MTESKKTLFDTLYEGCEETIKKMRKPLAVRSIKRKLRSGWDDAQNSIEKAEERIEEETRKINDADFNRILGYMADIRNLKEQQEDLAAYYKKLFNEEFKSDMD